MPAAPPGEAEKPSEPFAFGDLNGSNRQHKALLDTPYFTGSFLLDVNYTSSLANPIDHTVVGSTPLASYTTTATPAGWAPDLQKGDTRIILALLLRF